uniref:Uncharacterized protein n=1 Tax=Arachis duranensis TaxID=130453 RepID=N1NFU7_ARADU|nr:hypothetical protein ARAX_ADH18B08-004 [Arachis duranensis]
MKGYTFGKRKRAAIYIMSKTGQLKNKGSNNTTRTGHQLSNTRIQNTNKQRAQSSSSKKMEQNAKEEHAKEEGQAKDSRGSSRAPQAAEVVEHGEKGLLPAMTAPTSSWYKEMKEATKKPS